jgi:hypothetical protein
MTATYDLSIPSGLTVAGIGVWDEFRMDANSDIYGHTMGLWFAVAGEMFYRGMDIPEDWKFSPGAASNGRNPDDEHWGLADLPNDDLEILGDSLHELYHEAKENGDDY